MTRSDAPILLVEDDTDISEIVQGILEGEGYQVVTAMNGREGLERLQQLDRPSLILLDLMMPVMSGGEFLAALRTSRETASIPVVLVSAWLDEAANLRSQAQGFLRKPISLNALLETVAQWCLPSGPGEAE